MTSRGYSDILAINPVLYV